MILDKESPLEGKKDPGYIAPMREKAAPLYLEGTPALIEFTSLRGLRLGSIAWLLYH
jgi:hypothetical protein